MKVPGSLTATPLLVMLIVGVAHADADSVLPPVDAHGGTLFIDSSPKDPASSPSDGSNNSPTRIAGIPTETVDLSQSTLTPSVFPVERGGSSAPAPKDTASVPVEASSSSSADTMVLLIGGVALVGMGLLIGSRIRLQPVLQEKRSSTA